MTQREIYILNYLLKIYGSSVAKKHTPATIDIPHKAFAKRLQHACEVHPRAPSGRGQQTWLKKELEQKYGEEFSFEAVRKWFTGLSLPRSKALGMVAAVLQVSESWLLLGENPAFTEKEKRQHDALVSGAVNYVVGLLQLAGGRVAFSEDTESTADFTAIMEGKFRYFEVKLLKPTGQTEVDIGVQSESHVVLMVLPTTDPLRYRIFMLPPGFAQELGDKKGGYATLYVRVVGNEINTLAGPIPEIRSFADIF